MSEVTRFDLVTKGRGFDTWQKMEADPDGEWVKAEDYDALRAEVERLRAENVSLVADGNSFKDVIDRLWWLIREGEKHFGTLWRYATLADIEATRKSSAFPTSAIPEGT